MAAPTEPSVYEGTEGVFRDSTLLTHTAVLYEPKFREVVFAQYPFLKSLALAAGGKKAVMGTTSFGNVAKSSGKGITYQSSSPQFDFPIMKSAPDMYQIGRLANINPQHNDPGIGGAYSFVRFVIPVMIPEEFIQDNTGTSRLMNRFTTELKLAQMTAAQQLNYIILGNTSAPTGSPVGISKLVSVTQTAAATGTNTSTGAGGISPAIYSWWNNQYATCTTVGGGGNLDRPLVLLRKMQKMLLTVRNLSGASDSQTLVGTTGAYQYYQRAQYADTTAQGVGSLRNSDYDGAGIDHCLYSGRPFIYDSAVAGPIGATASTESIYFLDYNEIGVRIRSDQYFKVEGWEAPRAHDKQRYYQLNLYLRCVPYVTNRRIQGVLYNIPANADAAADAATIPT